MSVGDWIGLVAVVALALAFGFLVGVIMERDGHL